MNEQVELELDERTAELLNRIMADEEAIRAACARVRENVNRLVGSTIPFTRRGRIFYGTVIGVLGEGRRDDILLQSHLSGNEITISPWEVFPGLRQSGRKAEAHGPEPTH